MKISQIFSEFMWKFSFNLFLILLEAFIDLLFPLFMGFAIDGAIQGDHWGAIQLGSLGIAVILIGGGRRFFDSRFYAQIYQKLGGEILSKMKDEAPTLKTARLGMIREVLEFLENSLPQLIANLIGIFGVLMIIAGLHLEVFWGSLLATLLVFVIYFFTRKKTLRLNAEYNDELEKQVEVITNNNKQQLDLHLKNMMKWNIKLSDLEMINFSLSWVILMSFLVVSIILAARPEDVQYGALFALIMYVFQYIGSVISLPLFYQSWLRLTEIKQRLEEI